MITNVSSSNEHNTTRQNHLHRFIKKLEYNYAHYIPLPSQTHVELKNLSAYQIEIQTCNGIQKAFANNQTHLDSKYFIKYNCTFFSDKNNAFFGNSYSSLLIPISFDNKNTITLNISNEDDYIRMYLFSPDTEQFKIIIEIVLITTTLNDIVVEQEVMGWTSIDDITQDQSKATLNINMGTCRELIYKDKTKTLPGSNLVYAVNKTTDLDNMKMLLPEYFLFGINTEIPGLLFRNIPKRISEEDPVKVANFDEIYLKNIEIELPSKTFEKELINLANEYQQSKIGRINNNITISKITLKSYVHNTFTNISKDLTTISLLQHVSNHLKYQGVIIVKNHFLDSMGLCAVICELNYVLNVPLNSNSEIEQITIPVACTVIIHSNVDDDDNNNFQSVNMFTGKGKTPSGDDMVDIPGIQIKMSYLISKSRDAVDIVYKDKEIIDLSYKIENTKQNLINEKNPQMRSLLQSELNILEEDYNNKNKDYNEIYNKKSMVELNKNNEQSYHNMIDDVNKQFMIDNQLKPNENQINNNNNQEEQIPVSTSSLIPNKNEDNVETNYFAQKAKESKLKETQNQNQPYKSFEEFTKFKQSEQEDSDKYYYNQNAFPSSSSSHHHIPQSNIHYQSNNLTSKNLPANERAELISQGLLPATDDDIATRSIPMLQLTFENEISKRSHFGDVFTFHFSAFKPPKTISTYDSIPNEIQFKFSFWEFNSFTTERALIKKPTMITITPSTMPMFIEKITQQQQQSTHNVTEDKTMKTTITYDPSINDDIAYKTFINYLLYKSLYISIINAETQMEFGFIKVPLNLLLKQGKSNVYYNKEFDIYDANTFDHNGSIQMIIKSEEIKTFQIFNKENIAKQETTYKLFNTADTINNKGSNNSLRKKVVSVAPFNMNTLTTKEKEILAKNLHQQKRVNELQKIKQFKDPIKTNQLIHNPNTFELDSETAKKVRVLMYFSNLSDNKNKQSSTVNIPNDLIEQSRITHENQSKFYETVNYAYHVKQINKQQILQKAINESNNNTLNISLIQGQPHFFNYVIFNNSSTEEVYQLVISNENESNQTIDTTVTVVSDSEDYQRITKMHYLKIPNDYKCISKNNYVLTKPYESVPVVIKLFSEYASNEHSKYTIWVYNQRGNPIYFMKVIITKVFPLIDHSFTYNVPSNKFNIIKFINPFKYNKAKTFLALNNLVSVDKNIKIVLNTSRDFEFKYKSPRNENEVYENYIFLYLDEHRDSLYATWKITIYTLETLEVVSRLGVKTKGTLNLFPLPTSRTVQMCSSDYETLYMDEQYSTPFIILPQVRYDINYVVYPKHNKEYELYVTCVDVSTKEVIKSWVVKTKPSYAEINQVIKLNCKIACVTNVKFLFTNPLDEFSVISFDSSNKRIMSLEKEMVAFDKNENKFINCQIKGTRDTGRAVVYVFATDAEDVFNETIQFDINFYN